MNDTPSVPGTKVLITGGSGEIGRAIGLGLAAPGTEILFTYFSNHEGAEQTRTLLESAGATVHVCRSHLGRDNAVEKLVSDAREALGRIDILIHNAASGVLKPFDELTPKHWDWTHTINARSFFFLVQSALKAPSLMGAGGRIIALSSLGATKSIPQYTAVGTSKAALEAAVRHFALELGPRNITANVVAPGIIDTASLQHFPHREDLLHVARLRTPMGRLTTPEDVSTLVSFLCKPEAGMITGQTFNVDGGYSSVG